MVLTVVSATLWAPGWGMVVEARGCVMMDDGGGTGGDVEASAGVGEPAEFTARLAVSTGLGSCLPG